MKRYKITNIKNKDEFHYLSEASANIFENNQIKNNQSFIRIKTSQDKEINILPSEWRIKYDGIVNETKQKDLLDNSNLYKEYQKYKNFKNRKENGMFITSEVQYGLDKGYLVWVDGNLFSVVGTYSLVQQFQDYWSKMKYIETQEAKSLTELTTEMA